MANFLAQSVIDQIVELRKRGMGIRAITRELGVSQHAVGRYAMTHRSEYEDKSHGRRDPAISNQDFLDAVYYWQDSGESVHDFVVKLRWPNGVSCPRCASSQVHFHSTDRSWKCEDCKRAPKRFTTKTHTIFDNTPISMDMWVRFISLFLRNDRLTSEQLSDRLDISCLTAYSMIRTFQLAKRTVFFRPKPIPRKALSAANLRKRAYVLEQRKLGNPIYAHTTQRKRVIEAVRQEMVNQVYLDRTLKRQAVIDPLLKTFHGFTAEGLSRILGTGIRDPSRKLNTDELVVPPLAPKPLRPRLEPYERKHIPYENETDISYLSRMPHIRALDAPVYDNGMTVHERVPSLYMDPAEHLMYLEEQAAEDQDRSYRRNTFADYQERTAGLNCMANKLERIEAVLPL